jgi:hypothetical protein
VIDYLGDGTERRADNGFEIGGSATATPIDWGAGGSSDVNTSLPFTWSANPFAQYYYFAILNTNGTVAASSGNIEVPEYFDEALPDGSYTALLATSIAGQLYWTTAPFTVTASGSSAVNEIAAAHWATNYVRQMADGDYYPYDWTPLETALRAQGTFYQATCTYFANELLTVIKQMNITAGQTAAHQPSAFSIYFDAGDGHTLVQFWDSADGYFIPLDANFDVATQYASTGQWASPQEVETATQTSDFSAIDYVALGPQGFADADGYYLDYPLLWLNPAGQSPWNSPGSYMTQLTTWPASTYGDYTVTSDQNPVTIDVDGNAFTPIFDATDPFSAMFLASSVSLPTGSTATVALYQPNCYVFTSNPLCPAATAARSSTAGSVTRG